MSIFRRKRDTKSSAARRIDVTPIVQPVFVIEPKLNDGAHDDSDVFVCKRPEPAAEAPVTLFVFGWHVVEPGPLSWVFPSLKTALDAARTMRNAAQWCIASGSEWLSVDDARSKGAVLIEQVV